MPNARLHHIGFVVESAEQSAPGFVGILAATESGTFEDPLQKARAVFLQMPSSDGVQIELIAPTEPSSPIYDFAHRGGGLHHLCYEVDDLDVELKDLRSRKAILLRPPKPGVAFEGRRIAWIITPEKLLIEYLERGLQSDSSSASRSHTEVKEDALIR